MGLFGRGDDDVLNNWSAQGAELHGIDFTKYDLATLGDDVAAIVSIPGAVMQAAKWTLGLPVVIGLVSWIAFSGRMSSWLLVPFVLGAMVLSTLGAALVGGFFTARKRLDLVSQATNRVVTVVNQIHTDVLQVKEGASTTSTRAIATGVLENAIFPIAFGFVEGAAEGTERGMIAKVTSRFSSAPMKLVQKSVIGAVERLPDKEIGALMTDVTSSTAALAEMSTMLSGLDAQYQRIAGEIENVVGHVSKATLTSTAGAAVLAMLPLLGWLAFGWIAS